MMGFSVGILAGLSVIVLLLVVSALISGSEVAFFALGQGELNELSKRKNRVSKTVLRLLGQPESLLATILIGNNLVNVAIILLSTWLSQELFDFGISLVLGFVIQTIVITFIILLIGEIVPKVYAARYSLRFACFMAIPVNYMRILFHPLSKILVRSTSRVQKRLKDKKTNLSMKDLSHALELTGEELEEEEKILKGIVKFGHTDVREVMKSRVDVVAIDISTPFLNLLELITETGYSRIPVYISDFDHIKGVLYVKDLLPHINKPATFRWQSLIRPPYFVPGNKKINDLLDEFQKQKIHLALVVDEYGGTSGLITLEDILEEIVGEISDESDDEEKLYNRMDDQSYLFEAKILLNDFCRVIGIADDSIDDIRGEAETLAGLILEMKGEIPENGDRFVHNGLAYIVEQVDERRISSVRVEIL